MNGASSMMNYQYDSRYTLYAIFSILHAVRFTLNAIFFHAIRSTLRQDQRAQKNLFMQNKPNSPRFCAKNEDFAQKQTQTNPIQTQFPKGQNERKFC